ncbi:MAG: hypothetical protein KC502_16565 [Myxococcales bacterium]|nr:hypothetical protein [Myxococcales bacterium]
MQRSHQHPNAAALLLRVGVLAVLGCGSPHVPSDLAPGDEAKSAVLWLQSVQRAGYERHDLPTYMRQWAPEATLTAARTARAGPHERTLTHNQIRQTRTERYHRRPADGRSLTWRDVHVHQGGKATHITWLAHSKHADGAELIAERFVLRRGAAGWRVVHNRFWPVWTQEKGRKRKTYSPETWKRLDVHAQRRSCFGQRCPARLLAAWRFGDAYVAAKLLTERPGGTSAHGWLLRGICAVLSGHVGDARPSWLRARALDPTIALPDWRSAANLPASTTPTAK